MSILSTIKADFSGIESDVAKFAKAFEKLFDKTPSALQTVENFTGEVAPVVVAAVAIADPVAEPAVAAALATVETGLAAIQAAATAAVSGTSLLASLENFASTVPTVLTGLDVKNPALTASIEKIVTLVTSEAKVLIPAVESWVKQIAAAKAPAAVPAAA
jgi:hypothetical protein